MTRTVGGNTEGTGIQFLSPSSTFFIMALSPSSRKEILFVKKSGSTELHNQEGYQPLRNVVTRLRSETVSYIRHSCKEDNIIDLTFYKVKTSIMFLNLHSLAE